MSNWNGQLSKHFHPHVSHLSVLTEVLTEERDCFDSRWMELKDDEQSVTHLSGIA